MHGEIFASMPAPGWQLLILAGLFVGMSKTGIYVHASWPHLWKLFPYLEQQGITGPPKVMWGKQDEIRELIKGSIEILSTEGITKEELEARYSCLQEVSALRSC